MIRALLLLPVLLSSALADTFVNPIAEGADPSVIRHGNQYIWCQSAGNRGVNLWISDRLTSLGEPHLVWEAPETGPWSREVWAPEIQFFDGRFYIYIAASDGSNANHLSYVLVSKDANPLGPYTIRGPLPTGDGADGKSPNVWSIDMTVFKHADKYYAVWSGWDAPGTDNQYLYIAPMKSPDELAGPRVLICDNDTHLWERTEEKQSSRGLAEGPEILQKDGRTFLIYSTAASWLPTYKLGMLELTGKDPLEPSAWKKHPEPVFRSTEKTFGVGHGSFVKSPDDSEWWHVYHAKRDRKDNWQRGIFVQPFTFNSSGFPDFGQPVAPGIPVARPAGEVVPKPSLPFSASLHGSDDLRRFSYYGHQQFISAGEKGIELGAIPQDPTNAYRSGEKLVLDGGDFTDFTVTTRLTFLDGNRDAGLVFRVSEPSVGFDAQKGYFAGLIPGSHTAILGKTDGAGWTEIARAPFKFEKDKELELGVSVSGPEITVTVGGNKVLTAKDETYKRGTVGVRVVDTHVRFNDLNVRTAP